MNELNGNILRKQSLLKSSTSEAEGTKSEVYTSHKRRLKDF